MITNLPAILRGRAIKEDVNMDELISKRAVIEIIEKARANVGHNLERSIGKSFIEILDDVGRDVDRLPPAQPEPCEDAVSRAEAKKILYDFAGHIVDTPNGIYQQAYKTYMSKMDKLPSVTPKQRAGKWIDLGDCEQCSKCKGTHLKEIQTVYGKATWIKSKFCPNCGAKMEVTE